MWLIISTPSNPASLMAFIFSSIEPFMPTVAHMIALRIGRFRAVDSTARVKHGAIAVEASAAPEVLKKSRLVMALCQPGYARHGHFRDFQLHFPIQFLGHELLGRVVDFFPGDFLAGVGSRAAHQTDECALRHPMSVINWFAVADAGEEFVVLDLVHVDLWAGIFITPLLFSFDIRRGPTGFGDAIRAHQVIRIIGVGVADLPLAEKYPDVV